MPIEDDFDTVAGTRLFVSADLPTVSKGAGAAAAFALLAWTEVGTVTSFGSVKGREYSTSMLSPVASAQDREKKGSFKLPNAEFECGWVEDDAGQIIVEAGANSNDIQSYKVEKQNGAIRYFTAQVMKFVENNGTSNDAVKGNITLLRQTDTISV